MGRDQAVSLASQGKKSALNRDCRLLSVREMSICPVQELLTRVLSKCFKCETPIVCFYNVQGTDFVSQHL